jgi:hypothetical protein
MFCLGPIKILKDSPLYIPLLKGLGGMAAVSYASTIIGGGNLSNLGLGISMTSAIYDFEISFTPKNWLHEAYTHRWPVSIDLNIINGKKQSPVFDPLNPYMQLYVGPMESAFCFYYESIKNYLLQKYKNNNNFPPHVKFCKIIRDGLSHGNQINITNGLSGEINGTRIDQSDNGKMLTYNLVTRADYVFMMLLLAKE